MSRCIIVGLDGACPDIVQAKIEAGTLPNFKRLREFGCCADNLPFPSAVTPGNWTHVATGAKPWTTGISDFCMHQPGTPLDEHYDVFDKADNNRAEFAWDAYADRGRKAATIAFPAALPQTKSHHLAIGNYGFPVENGDPWTITKSRALVAGGLNPCGPYNWQEYEKVELQPATRSAGIDNFVPRYQLEFTIQGRNPGYGGEHPLTLLLGELSGEAAGVLLDGDTALLLKPRAWSPFLQKPFARDNALLQRWLQQPLEDATVAGEFRLRITELDLARGELLLYISTVYPQYDFSTDPAFTRSLRNELGPYNDNLVISRLLMGWIDDEAFYDEFRLQGVWQARAAVHLVNECGYDMVFLKWHAFDKFYHFYMQRIDPIAPTYNAAEHARYEKLHDMLLAIADEMVGIALDGLRNDTSLVVMSDHGLMASRRSVWVNRYLAQHGYIAFKPTADGNPAIDWSRTRAYVSGYQLLNVNLKGRDPEGIVEPGEEHEQTRRDLIRLLREWYDDQTGEYVMSDVFDPQRDGAFYGLGSELDGDVRYFTAPGYTLFRSISPFGAPAITDAAGPFLGDHGSCRPTTRYGRGSEVGLFYAAGKGFKMGVRRPYPIQPIDIVPTLLHIAGEKPLANQEGAVLYDLLSGI